MSEASDLEWLLAGESSQGQYDSSGRFTLDSEKALETLARQTWPSPEAWILKIVQAAVTSEATQLVIKWSQHQLEFLLDPRSPWNPEQIEAEFYSTNPCPDRSLEHLKRGLWVWLASEARFAYTLANSGQSLVWQNRQFSTQPCKSQPSLSLKITLPTAATAIPIAHFKAIEDILRQRACTAPIPVFLEASGKRIQFSNLLSILEHDISRQTWSPIQLLDCLEKHNSLPVLQGLTARTGLRQTSQVWLADLKPSYRGQVLGILGIGPDPATTRTTFSKQKNASQIHWILDGVIVGSERIRENQQTISAELFASAQGETLDLSGLVLVQSDQLRLRRNQVLRTILPQVQSQRLRFRQLLELKQSSTTAGSLTLYSLGGVGLVATALTGVWPLAIFGSTCLGVARHLDSQTQRMRENQAHNRINQLQAELEMMKNHWHRLAYSPDEG